MRGQIFMLLVSGLLAAACGGSGLQERVPDQVLADVPVDQKQGVVDAQTAVDEANQRLMNAQAQIDVDQRNLAIANDGLAQANLEVKKADASLDLARHFTNLEQIQAAKNRLALAHAGVDAARARIDVVQQQLALDQAQVRADQQGVLLAKARRELVKAQLAQQLDKRPTANFSVASFQEQVQTQEARTQDAESQVARVRGDVEAAEARYAELAAQYRQQWNQAPEPRPIYMPPARENIRASIPPTPTM